MEAVGTLEDELEAGMESRPLVVRWFKGLTYHEKKEMLAVFGSLMPRPKNYLICNADVSEVGLILKYCHKHQIVYDVEKFGKKRVRFTFADQAVRNAVLIGVRTL